MEKFAVHLSPQAKRNLREITGYYIKNKYPIVSFLRAVEDGLSQLKVFPKGYSLVQTEPYLSMGYRKIHVKNYYLIYEVDDKNKIVNIIAVTYVHRNLSKN